MKRFAIAVLTFGVLAGLTGIGLSQGNPRGLTSVKLGGNSVSVDYGRPSLKGQTVDQEIGRLNAGGFWRLGADSSTTFKSSTALKFGDTTIPAGTYSLWLQKQSDNSWKLVFNKQHGQWGTDHDPSRDFAFIPMHQGKASASVQELIIRLIHRGNGGAFLVHWGDMELTTPFTGA